MNNADEYTIYPARSKGVLSSLPLPYSVYKQRPFNLDDHVREIDCDYHKVRKSQGDATTSVGKNEQLKHWLACLDSVRTGQHTGWTLCVAGPGSINYPEAVAAQLAAEYLIKSKIVAWVNITAGLYGKRDLDQIIAPYSTHSLSALIITGIRWDGDNTRFDKAFDLLRQTREQTDRIIVGVGADPLALTRRMDISLNRAINVTESKFVHM